MPSHTHSEVTMVRTGPNMTPLGAGSDYDTAASGATTGGAGSSGAHNHTITMNIQYVDLIIASKN